MIFVDTNVLMYAVGKEHSLKAQASEFFRASVLNRDQLCTSAEVLQELLHIYLTENRLPTFEAAVRLVADLGIEVWPLEMKTCTLPAKGTNVSSSAKTCAT